MRSATIYVTRHGETVWNVEHRLQGQRDSPLTPRGILQATWLRDALRDVPLDGIYTSSSPRARATAQILGEGRAVEIQASDDLREIDLGAWEGQLISEAQARHPAEYAAFWETPHLYRPVSGGESFAALQRRVVTAVEGILARHHGQTILLVTHAAALKALLSHFERRPLERLWQPPYIHPTALCKVVIANGLPTIELYGDISHYQEHTGGQ